MMSGGQKTTTANNDGIERKILISGGLLFAAGILFRSTPITFGLLIGVLVAFFNYRMTARLARTLIADQKPASSKIWFLLYLLKYGFIAAVVLAALKFKFADAIAIVIGVSVLLPAIVWETAANKRTISEEV